MKKYTFDYPNSFGSFLEWKLIPFELSHKDYSITIELENDTELVNLIREYAEWYENLTNQ